MPAFFGASESADGDVAVGRTAFASLPCRFGMADDGIDGMTFGVGRRGIQELQIHTVTSDRLDPHRSGLEFRRARLRVPDVDGQLVDIGLVGEVDCHEGQTRPQ